MLVERPKWNGLVIKMLAFILPCFTFHNKKKHLGLVKFKLKIFTLSVQSFKTHI